jgi:S-DNA-T family DNA segregation ATPase FtsK/SpoIIIE
VLIAGKTGSGKSSLLHTILTAGAAYYPPDQLNFYLLDFKKGVEFKIYADAPLPHARVIGIESEREFGRSVLQRLDGELQQRGEAFRAAGAQELAEYRGITGKSLPRVMLVVDEFQELFVRDDRLAADCAMLLDRMVRQGRSFGMHVVLSSQSLAGAHSLPRATLGQMAVRIAMQCSESDAAMILGDDNTAAKFISRPGEAIYNDAGGLLEGNQPFQVAYLNRDDHDTWLAEIARRDSAAVADLAPPVVFEGNRPCRWTSELAAAAITSDASTSGKLVGLLGESVEIGPPAAIVLSRESGRNVMLVAPQESTAGLLASILSGFAASAKRSGQSPEIAFFDGSPMGQDSGQASLATWIDESGLSAEVVKPRDCVAKIAELAARVRHRVEADQTDQPPIVVVIDPLNRFSDLRQDDSFSFSLDAAAGVSGPAALQSILRDGPGVGVFSILCCTSAETITRWLPRQSRHDLQQRILGRVNASDSAALIDSNEAAGLSPATMLIYDDSDGTYRKFRTCDLADPADVRTWLDPGVD